MTMKNNYFLMLFVLLTLKSFSQDPVLFDHTWYLEKVVIDNEEIFAVSNQEVSHIELNFNEIEVDHFVTDVYNALFGDLVYAGMDSFTFQFMAQTLIECELIENAIFEGIYFNLFFSSKLEAFTYELTTFGDTIFLVITNFQGNQSFYGNQPFLSTEIFLKPDISLFPNPAQTILNIQTKSTENIIISLYALYGTLLYNQVLESFDTAIDIKGLSKGAYFLVIEGENGTKQFKKFLKK